MAIIPSNSQFRVDTTGVEIVEKGSFQTNSRASIFKMEDITDTVVSQVPQISIGTEGQIPYVNSSDDDLDYSSNFTWDASNSRLGIGTDSPSTLLELHQQEDNKGLEIYGYDNLSTRYIKIGVSNFGQPFITTNTLSRFNIGGAFVISDGSYTRFSGGGFQVSHPYMSVGSTSNLGAKLNVKGSGSTSSTTSLLLENSSGTELFKVTDNGAFTVGAGFVTNSYIGVHLFKNGASNWLKIDGGVTGANTAEIRSRGNSLTISADAAFGNGDLILNAVNKINNQVNNVLKGTWTSNGLNLPSLPTSSTGLNAGDVWNDGGTLKIV